MNLSILKYHEIIAAIVRFDEKSYAQTRNFTDGKVSRLSPYISRGMISTKLIFQIIVEQSPDAKNGKFVQELLWRDYFQRLLQARADLAITPIRISEPILSRVGIPIAILNAATGIFTIDQAIRELYETGYMHNHQRLYVAALCCNIAKTHFHQPASWMYYHLLDADIASNYASWQWVSGLLTGKKYICNQDNINYYCKSSQKGTFLDVSYEEIMGMRVPDIFSDLSYPVTFSPLPKQALPILSSKPVLLYTFYNLDPLWHQDDDYNRILILEPSHFEQYPISEKVMAFTIQLAQNIPGIQIYSGEYGELRRDFPDHHFITKEHPILKFEHVTVEQRDWIVPEVEGFYPSFSQYYNACKNYFL